MKPTMKMKKDELYQLAVSSQLKIEELESTELSKSISCIITKIWYNIDNEFKGDCLANHLEEFIRAIVPAIVCVYVAGVMTKNLTARISKSFVYESPRAVTTVQPCITSVDGLAHS